MGAITTLFFSDSPRRSKGLSRRLVFVISAIDLASVRLGCLKVIQPETTESPHPMPHLDQLSACSANNPLDEEGIES
jgi:hypothetical protein